MITSIKNFTSVFDNLTYTPSDNNFTTYEGGPVIDIDTTICNSTFEARSKRPSCLDIAALGVKRGTMFGIMFNSQFEPYDMDDLWYFNATGVGSIHDLYLDWDESRV